MGRLIDADEFLRKYNESKELVDLYLSRLLRLDVEGLISEMPTIDAVPVVRCKDCKHWSKTDQKECHNGEIGWCDINSYIPYGEGWNAFGADEYCSRGEKKDNG